MRTFCTLLFYLVFSIVLLCLAACGRDPFTAAIKNIVKGPEKSKSEKFGIELISFPKTDEIQIKIKSYAPGLPDHLFSHKLFLKMRTFTAWEGDDLWVYSGDIGTYVMTYHSNQGWVENAYDKSTMKMPIELERAIQSGK